MKAKALTLDDEWVEGWYDRRYVERDDKTIMTFDYISSDDLEAFEELIDPQTLEYQIGSKWYSYNDLQYAVDVWESYVGEEK